MGGGYRVGNPAGYGPGALTEFPTADDYAMAVAGTAKELCAEWDLGTPRLILEAGGYLVTDAVALLARVGLKKTRRAGGEAREWASIENTSGYHFVRRLMFRFHHEVVVANRMRDAADTRVSISGPICADDDVGRRGAAAGAAPRRPDRSARQRLVLRGGDVRLLRRPDPAQP